MIYRAVLAFALLAMATLVVAQSEAPVTVPPAASPNERTNHNENGLASDQSRSTGSISGTVVTLDGHTVGNAHVELHALDTGMVLGSVYSNAGGAFELYNVPSGRYEVVANAGLAESRERVDVQGAKTFVNLQMPNGQGAGTAAGATVSVESMKVPDKARKAFEKAQEAYQKNKLDEARSQTEKALKIYPDYADALALRGLLKMQNGKVDEGRMDLETAVSRDPNDGMAYVALGSAYNTLHRSDDALRVLNRGVSLVPNAWQAYFERARALVSKKLFAPAIGDLNKAKQLATTDFPVMHLVKANALMGLQDYPEAKTELQAYLDREPQGTNADIARRVLEQMKSATAASNSQNSQK